jgi:small neutral amino acid transporter SnatA (MarC family)
MDTEKEKQEISLIGRIFSLEALLIIMGGLSLASGIIDANWMRISLGIVIIAGGIFLMLIVRKRSDGKG